MVPVCPGCSASIGVSTRSHSVASACTGNACEGAPVPLGISRSDSNAPTTTAANTNRTMESMIVFTRVIGMVGQRDPVNMGSSGRS